MNSLIWLQAKGVIWFIHLISICLLARLRLAMPIPAALGMKSFFSWFAQLSDELPNGLNEINDQMRYRI